MNISRHSRAAFSLVEISVVIAVIALLVGGVLGGRSLIHASELRSVITDANSYITALNSFKAQYRGLPGDIINAANYWSTASNGDGDGRVPLGPALTPERFQYWKQLNLAGFINKSYTGIQGASGINDFTLGGNIPDSRVTKSGFSAYYLNQLAPAGAPGTTFVYNMNYGNMIAFGGTAAVGAGPPIRANLSPVDGFGIDTKADDGLPGSGNWIANLTGAVGFASAVAIPCSNATTVNDYAGTYNTQVADTLLCSFFVITGS